MVDSRRLSGVVAGAPTRRNLTIGGPGKVPTMRVAFTITFLAVSFFISACATPEPEVVYLPGGDGRSAVVVSGTFKNEAEVAAIVAAQSYCERDSRDAVLVARRMSYGSQKQAGASQTDAVEIIAAPASGSHAQNDYRSEIFFTCQ